MRRITHAVLATVLATVVAGSAGAQETTIDTQGGGQDTTAIAINTKDGTEVFTIRFSIFRTNREIVDNGNAAVAASSCTDCQAVAVAIQVVLVFSDPEVVSPTNLALAINIECTECTSVAEAFQIVLGTGGPAHFSADGNQALAEIRNRLHDLMKGELTLEQLEAELQDIVADLKVILENELVSVGTSDGTEQDAEAVEEAVPTQDPESSPAPIGGETSEPTGTSESPPPSDTPTSASPAPSPTS
jgi:putative peptide zinc metalloprotease protein